MIAVIFEVTPREGEAQSYFELAAALRPELEKIDGFLSVERFESVNEPGRYLSLSFWRDHEAVAAWHDHDEHRLAQDRGKREIFERYRIRVAEVVRDYGAEGEAAR